MIEKSQARVLYGFIQYVLKWEYSEGFRMKVYNEVFRFSE